MKLHKENLFPSCAVISEIVLFKGIKGLDQKTFESQWGYNSNPPSIVYIRNFIKSRNIKWYIHNFINIVDPVWNGDFIHGLSTIGNKKWRNPHFGTLEWSRNHQIHDILSECPFHGNLSKQKTTLMYWFSVPALHLKYDEKSVSFMAGVLATGKIRKRNNNIYACYNKKSAEYIRSWGIPIEYTSNTKRINLISPFWPSLFTFNMPVCCDKWLKIKNGGYKSHIYASTLYRMYVSNYIERNKIPYLKSRRWVYDQIGNIKDTEMFWLKSGLTQLDNRIKKQIQFLSKNV